MENALQNRSTHLTSKVGCCHKICTNDIHNMSKNEDFSFIIHLIILKYIPSGPYLFSLGKNDLIEVYRDVMYIIDKNINIIHQR